jgi:diguanylate cyclase (GGDEF)-like protein/hemerythrin-like metal-binding protein
MISNTVIAPESEHYIGRFWLFEDATEEKKLLQLAEQRGEQDSLTLLFNRQRYDKDLLRAIAQAERDGSRIALLIFDLDDFKPVNDLYGHAAGDIVLKQVAQTLAVQMRRNEVLYRIGGDEFALLLVNASDEEVTILAERIVQSVHSLSFNFNGATAKVGCSLGIARYPHDARTLPTLMQLADHAMYVAKNNGKGQFVFSSSLQVASSKLKQPSSASLLGDINLGVSILDAQHVAIANFIQGILDSLANGDQSAKMLQRVELLVELCQIHFQTEEDLMRSNKIPSLKKHHIEYQQQLMSLRKLFGKLNFNEEELPVVAHEIKEWLLGHIRDHDTKLAEILKNKSIS